MNIHTIESRAKVLFLAMAMCLTVIPAFAGPGDQFFHLNAGYLYNNTLNITFGYEQELSYDNAVEVFGELGDRWSEDPVCGKVCSKSFWKKHYWNGGLLYKKSVRRWRNSSLRLDFGVVAGAYKKSFFYGIEGSFEYNYVFRSGWKFVVKQKNNINFRRGDTFRDGLTLGVKVPL